jgi:hypothetical protein
MRKKIVCKLISLWKYLYRFKISISAWVPDVQFIAFNKKLNNVLLALFILSPTQREELYARKFSKFFPSIENFLQNSD